MRKKSRKVKKLQYIQLKNKIVQDGYNFHTIDLIHDKTTWADICFIGKNKTIYNATIYTTKCAWHDLLDKLAWEKLYSILPKDFPLFEIEEMDGYTETEAFSGPTTISDPPIAQLNNLTASQFLDEQVKNIAQDKTLMIHERFEILPNFSYGIGLDMVVHYPYLSNERIAKCVEAFINYGEKNFVSKESYNFEYEENSNFTVNALRD